MITAADLAGAHPRRGKRALFALFKGASQDVVRRGWRKGEGSWEAWRSPSLAEEDNMHLMLAATISILAAMGVRRDGQKVLLAIQPMAEESTAAGDSSLNI